MLSLGLKTHSIVGFLKFANIGKRSLAQGISFCMIFAVGLNGGQVCAGTWHDKATKRTWSFTELSNGISIENVSGPCVYPRPKGTVEIPSEINGKAVIQIGMSAFEGCKEIQKAILPSSITCIRRKAFFGCIAMEEVRLPEGLVRIESAAFAQCSKLRTVSLPSGLRELTPSVFAGCSSLEIKTIPSGVTSIGMFAFRGCENLNIGSLPEGVTNIGSKAFLGCSKIVSFKFPKTLKCIGGLTDCHGIVSVEIPEGATEIQDEAFSGCENLVRMKIPASMERIGCSYVNCSKLEGLVIPEKVTKLDPSAFDGCVALIDFKRCDVNVKIENKTLRHWTYGWIPDGSDDVKLATIKVPKSFYEAHKGEFETMCKKYEMRRKAAISAVRKKMRAKIEKERSERSRLEGRKVREDEIQTPSMLVKNPDGSLSEDPRYFFLNFDQLVQTEESGDDMVLRLGYIYAMKDFEIETGNRFPDSKNAEHKEAKVENSSATTEQKQESAGDSKSSISKSQINQSAVASTNVTNISIGESGKNILDGATDVGKGLFNGGKGAVKSISDGFKSLW